jgi:hypothetical protein
MSDDLFEAGRQDKRRRLIERGWGQLGGKNKAGEMLWLRPAPDRAILTESEAFTQLERLEAEEAARETP